MQNEMIEIDVEPTAQTIDNAAFVGEHSAARADCYCCPTNIGNEVFVVMERLIGTFDSEQAEQALQALNGMQRED